MLLRSWNVQDYDELAKILCETWNAFTIMSTYEDGLKKAKLYIQQCLEESTNTQVLEVKKEVVGVLFIASKLGKSSRTIKKAINYDTDNQFSNSLKEKYQKSNQQYRNICTLLKSKSQHSFDGEIVLLVIKPSFKGRGLGNFLFYEAIKHFKKTGSKEFYLYTNSSCDYTFYHHHGMKKASEVAMFPNTKNQSYKIYLYNGYVKEYRTCLLPLKAKLHYRNKEYCVCTS